jgi:hypothetical protein
MSIAQPWHLGVVFLYFIKGSPYLLVGLGLGRMDIATRHRLFSQLISSFNVIIEKTPHNNNDRLYEIEFPRFRIFWTLWPL